ncbi:permease [uncultured Methanolobus sp.]|uniref:permease n=1 Tax=uncultured Methanolobus sp. TaxID=218300 RepID=UPI0029C62D2E|nr:permease [uncultured Methanolobus sp.]
MVCGILAGLCVRLFFRDKGFFNFSTLVLPGNRDTDLNMLMRLQKNVWRNIRATGGYFLIGIVLAALFQRYVSPDLFAGLFGSQWGFGVLMAATVGVPLYVCGGGTILCCWNGCDMA